MAGQEQKSLLAGTLGARPLQVVLWHLAAYVLSGITSILLPWRRRTPSADPEGPAVPAAVVTGADTGIGREISLFLAQKGWRVYAGAYTQEGLQQLPALHPGIKALPMDVTKTETLKAAAQQVAEGVGSAGLQLLVNNAGIALLAPAEAVNLDQYKHVFDVNVFGVLAASQVFLPLLRKGRYKGRIINIGSAAGHLAMPFWGAYSGSKHALEGLTDCMRFELAPQGIHVALIKPGPIKTAIWEDNDGHYEDFVGGLSPELSALYTEDIKGMLREGQRALKAAVPVSDAVAAIYKAATEPNPAFRHHVGPSVVEMFWVKRLLPDAVWEASLTQLLREQFTTGTDALEIPPRRAAAAVVAGGINGIKHD